MVIEEYSIRISFALDSLFFLGTSLFQLLKGFTFFSDKYNGSFLWNIRLKYYLIRVFSLRDSRYDAEGIRRLLWTRQLPISRRGTKWELHKSWRPHDIWRMSLYSRWTRQESKETDEVKRPTGPTWLGLISTNIYARK